NPPSPAVPAAPAETPWWVTPPPAPAEAPWWVTPPPTGATPQSDQPSGDLPVSAAVSAVSAAPPRRQDPLAVARFAAAALFFVGPGIGLMLMGPSHDRGAAARRAEANGTWRQGPPKLAAQPVKNVPAVPASLPRPQGERAPRPARPTDPEGPP